MDNNANKYPSDKPPNPRRKRALSIAGIVFFIAFVIILTQVGFYSVQPIGLVPEGVTLLVRRGISDPFFNSADAECLEYQGQVTLLCRGIALGNVEEERVILKLPYIRWFYLLSTGGEEFLN